MPKIVVIKIAEETTKNAPLDKYLSAGVHIGMRQKTHDMATFIYKIRPDGLAVLDVQTIDKRLGLAAKFLSRFKNILVVSRKSNGRKPVLSFEQMTGAKAVSGRLLPGTLTNPDFKRFMEPDVILITDPVADSQALKEAVKMRIPIIAICDTFNETRNIDFVIPSNNKGRKALALIYWVLAKEFLKSRDEIKSDEEMKLALKDFLEPKERVEVVDMRKELLAPRKKMRGRKR